MVGRQIVKLVESHPFLQVGATPTRDQLVDYEPEALVLSALSNEIAPQIEEKIIDKGGIVVSNASYDRSHLILPGINFDEIGDQPKRISVPNCVTCGLTMALKPLVDVFGVEAVHVTSLQAISGAGYPGVASLDILSNVIPFIENEEEKIESEPLKLLNETFPISATAMRVPVEHGHLVSVSVKLRKSINGAQLVKEWNAFPHTIYSERGDYPQPKRDLTETKVSIGRLRKCPNFDYKFVILSHNLIQGAAHASVQIAEYLCQNLKNRNPLSKSLKK